MADNFTIVAAALAVSLVWIWLATRQGRNGGNQPLLPMAGSFVTGMVFTLPALSAEELVLTLSGGDPASVLVASGPIEECAKLVAALPAIALTARFGTKGWCTAHAVSASMGFAAAENVAYLHEFGLEGLLIRGTMTTVIHLGLALVWGRAFELRRTPNNLLYPMAAMALASVIHTGYNLVTIDTGIGATIAASALSLAWVLYGYPRVANADPQLQPASNNPVCTACTAALEPTVNFCQSCGTAR